MVFQYSMVKVDGTAEGVEGVSAALQEISTFMQACGWTLVDDRSAEPSTGVDATHHKMVFSSNGEEGNYPTFFITVYSGTNTSMNGNVAGFVASTAYDVDTHTVPASGVRSTSVELATTAETVNIRSQDDNTELYMSGDSEMVHIVTRREITNNSASLTMDNAYFGRFNSFMTVDESPYPMVVVGPSSVTISTALNSVKGIGGNPPQSFVANSEMDIIAGLQGVYDTVQPYNLGDVTSVFFAQPLLVYYDDINPIRKGVAGTIRNGWIGVDGTRMNNLSLLTASGDFGEQTYLAFIPETSTTTYSIIIRKS